MKILSLFDGISCARVALERVGISVEAYYASEVDKYAIQISKKNYPEIRQIGSVTDIKGEVLHLSGVYDMLKEYDIDIQNKFSEQEMLYWLNEDFSISAKIGTQITNADTPESASLQRIEEIWFSRSGVGDIIKTQRFIGSRVIGENGDTQTQELLLQCGEWGYVYRSDTRNQEENIGGVDGEKTKTRKHRKDTTISNQTIQQSSITNNTIGTDKERNVEAEKPQEISIGIKEQKEWGASTAPNRKEYARSKVQNVSFPLQTKNDNERITDREWIQLSIRKEMETTMVRTPKSIDIFLGTFEIMCGGSPCQDLSIAKKNRKGLDGDRSGLFWEYVRILKEVKPKYFILENVNSMPKEAKAIITEALGVEPIMINASLVSAQNRKRLFWTNIPNVTQPEDMGILLKDILEDGDTVINPKMLNFKGDTEKCMTLTSSMYKEPPMVLKEKSNTIRTGGRGSGAGDKHDRESVYQYRRTYWRETKGGKVPTLTANMGTEGNNVPYVDRDKAYCIDANYHKGASEKHYKEKGVRQIVYEGKSIRKLTTLECERLQSLPDGYTEGVSNTQRYKALGNAFNVDVVAHILSFIPNNKARLN